MSGETDSTVWQAYRANLKKTVYGLGELAAIILLSTLVSLWLFAPMVVYSTLTLFGPTTESWTLVGAVLIGEVVWAVVIAWPLLMAVMEDDQ